MIYPKVTVVTATYNLIRAGRAETIVQAIESVHDQKYEGEIEHLIMDGASDDGTLDLLAPFSEKGWIKVVSEKDRGLYDAMNKGIAIASGKYTVFLNSDDYWSSEFAVQKSVEALEREQADFSYGRNSIEDEEGRRPSSPPNLGIFFLHMPFCHQAMFMRTDLLRELGGFNSKKYKISADYDVILRAILSGKKSACVNLDFVTFRLGGVSANVELMDSETIDIMYENFKSLDKITRDDCWNYHYERVLPFGLYTAIKQKVSPEIAESMNKIILSGIQIGNLCYLDKRCVSKNIFWRYFFYNTCLSLGISKKRSARKMLIEKRKIDAMNVYKKSLFGLCIYKKYYDSKIKSYHIFNLPILTIMEK